MSKKKTSDLTDRYLAKLHQGTKATTQENARELRHRTTAAEQKAMVLVTQQATKRKEV